MPFSRDDTRHPFVVQCEQFKTARLLLDRLRAYPNVEVLFDHEVIDVSQSRHAVSVRGARTIRRSERTRAAI